MRSKPCYTHHSSFVHQQLNRVSAVPQSIVPAGKSTSVPTFGVPVGDMDSAYQPSIETATNTGLGRSLQEQS